MLASTTVRSFFNGTPLLFAACLNEDGAVTVPPTHGATRSPPPPRKMQRRAFPVPGLQRSSQLLLPPVKPHAGACWPAASVPARMTSAWHRRDDDVAGVKSGKKLFRLNIAERRWKLAKRRMGPPAGL